MRNCHNTSEQADEVARNHTIVFSFAFILCLGFWQNRNTSRQQFLIAIYKRITVAFGYSSDRKKNEKYKQICPPIQSQLNRLLPRTDR